MNVFPYRHQILTALTESMPDFDRDFAKNLLNKIINLVENQYDETSESADLLCKVLPVATKVIHSELPYTDDFPYKIISFVKHYHSDKSYVGMNDPEAEYMLDMARNFGIFYFGKDVML